MTDMAATLNLSGRRVLLVGGGEAAARYGAWLDDHGARLRVVAEVARPVLREAAAGRDWPVFERAFAESDLAGCHLAVAASDSTDLNRRVAEAADRTGVLVQALGWREGSSLALPMDPDTPPPRLAGHRGVGRAYLVGAGPGDPKLLTLRAREVLENADAVLYDRLVAPALMELVPASARRIYVGKAASRHALPQGRINELLVELAGEGLDVVRLKGGDPFVFGRGGEEIHQLKTAGVPFEVVPGITAALGCSAYAGIPLTHRDHAQVVTFVTGHLRDGSLDLPWEALVQPSQTVVVYMGIGGLDRLCAELRRRGLPGSHPAAVIQRGTLDDQAVISGTLADLPERARREGVRPPSLVIIGEVVRLREQLDWFSRELEAMPMAGYAAC
ncbi:uroporphyrinogen-III C-methyltransferase [Arhodomonas sp. SL1]|uniref:uroporphyrinogen-III C-methyltransferase n=1 Tax=Arhodomonas sp. SL1 TaxID=3425691 RepID=UPI003F881C16